MSPPSPLPSPTNAVNKSYILFHPHPTPCLGLILLIGNYLPLDYSFLQNMLSDLEMNDTEKFKNKFSGDFFFSDNYAECYGHGFLKTPFCSTISLNSLGRGLEILSGSSKICMCAQSLQSCRTLCDPMDRSLSSSPVHGILQARLLEKVAMSSSRQSSQPRDRTYVSCISCIAGRLFTCQNTWEAHLRSVPVK